jgi:protein-S-isoprenylcysteine O-methyltransferase Ste14
MSVLALVLLVAWVLLVAGLRGVMHYRQTGTPAVRFEDPRGSAQWWARLLSVVGFVFAVAAPLADLAGLDPIAVLDRRGVAFAGVALVIIGCAVTVMAQLAMGDSWRGDVDPGARTALVTTGPFRLVRNPILAGTALTATGLALIVPNVLAAGMLAAFIGAWEVQVRKVAEPYLQRVHDSAYRAYAERTGRFLPGIGRLCAPRRDVG